MKKLMTMIAAVATAFGLYAADPEFKSGADFNSFTPGPFNTAEDTTATWSGVDTDDEIVTATWKMPSSVGVPEEYAESGNGQCLKIKTTLGNPIERECDSITADNVFVDFLTEMTVFDEVPTSFGTGAKIGLWLQEVENANGTTKTNVWLHAGKFNAQGAVEAFDYDCGDASQYHIIDWNRVTVKAIADIDGINAGFVVFINKIALNLETYDIGKAATAFNAKAQKWITAKALFPSLGAAGISALGFDGQGQVDDIAFTTIVPGVAASEDWAKDDDVYTVTWTNVKNNLVSLTIDGKVVDPTTGSYTGVIPANKKVVIAWTGTAGFIDGSKTVENVADLASLELTATDVKAAAAVVDGLKLALLSDAVATANVATVDCELKLLADATAQVTFENASAKITIDLNSHALQVFTVNSGDVIVNDSAEGGKIDGEVFVDDETATLLFNAGKVKYADNEDLLDFTTISVKDGYKFEKQDDYWVLVVKPYELEGEGTETSPWLIKTTKDFAFLRDQLSNSNEAYVAATAFYRQESDIDLSTYADWTGLGGGLQMTSKGIVQYDGGSPVAEASLKGTYDGNGKTIKSGIITGWKYAGCIFNGLYGAKVKNLTVDIVANDDTAKCKGGSAFGSITGGAELTGVTVKGTVNGTHNLGAFACAVQGTLACVDCTNECAVIRSDDSSDKIGGFFGLINNTANVTMTRCVNKAAVTGKCLAVFAIGGFIGNVNAGTVRFQDCVNEGVVSSTQAPTSECIGSFVGAIDEGSATIHACTVIDLGGNIDTANATLPMVGAIKPTTAATTSVTGFFQPAAGGATVAAPTAGGEYKVLTLTNMTALAITGDLTLTSAAGFGGTVTSADDTKKVEVDDQGATKVYTLVNKSTPIDPEQPETGKTSEQADARVIEINKNKEALIAVPTELKGVTPAEYVANVEAKKVKESSGDTYAVIIDIAQAKEADVKANANTAETAIAAKLSDVAAGDTEATITAIKGLFYTVVSDDTIGGMEPGTSVPATSDSITVTLPHYEGAGFYQIKVTAAPIK